MCRARLHSAEWLDVYLEPITVSPSAANQLVQEPDAWIYSDGDPHKEPIGLVFSMPDHRQVFVGYEYRRLQYSRACYLLAPSANLRNKTHGANFQPVSKLGAGGDIIEPDMQEWLRHTFEGLALPCNVAL